MANTVKHGKDSRIFIGDYDFSGQGRSIDLTVFQADIADATVFTSPARVKSPGSYSAKVDHKGIFTNAVSGWDNWLVSKLGNMSGQPISVLLGQPANGDVAYHGEIIASNVKVPVKVDDVIGTEATYEIHRALARGTLLQYAIGSNVGLLNGTGVVLGPIAAGELLQVTVHIVEKIASGEFYVRVQHASNGAAYTTITNDASSGTVTATTGSGALISAILRIPGPIDDYIRAQSEGQNLTEAGGKFIVVASKIHKSE